MRWPDAATVQEAVTRWALAIGRDDSNVQAVGYFGSYARGEAGVGSDLDIVIVLQVSDQPFQRRALAYDATRLPVPADVLVYTQQEWDRMQRQGGRFPQMLRRDTVWVYRKDSVGSAEGEPRPGGPPRA